MALQAWHVALVTPAQAAREQLDDREYEALVDLVGRWFDAERDRLRRGARLRQAIDTRRLRLVR
jgi:hypothetical protein